jgi:hypothetical protein
MPAAAVRAVRSGALEREGNASTAVTVGIPTGRAITSSANACEGTTSANAVAATHDARRGDLLLVCGARCVAVSPKCTQHTKYPIDRALIHINEKTVGKSFANV